MKDKYDMQFLTHMLKKHKETAIAIVGGILILGIYLASQTNALGPNYSPGETLDPAEGPGTAVVVIPTGWGLTGTSGLVDGTNFIGTTSAAGDKPLNFKVNGEKAGRIGDSLGDTFLGYQAGNSNPTAGDGYNNTFIGASAGYTNTTGVSNTALGTGALYFNTVGYQNTANGATALNSNIGGYQNTAIGSQALFSNTEGNSNVANGHRALYSNTTGIKNTANGWQALAFNSIGSNNTALGYNAGYGSVGTGNVFIGYQAGFYESGNDKLYIANSDTMTPLIYGDFATGNIGIGTAAPGAKLHIDSSSNDVLRITDGANFTNYAYLNIGKNSVDNKKETTINETGFGPTDTDSALTVYASTTDDTKYALRVGKLDSNNIFGLRADGRAYFGNYSGLSAFKSVVTIAGELQLLDSDEACDADHVGAIKYEDDDDNFYGCRTAGGGTWTLLN